MPALRLTDNSKVKFKKNHYNTFGLNFGRLEDGGTCPGSTKGKGGCLCVKNEGDKNVTCYMSKLVKAWKTVRIALQQNTDLVKDKSEAELEDILTDTIADFVDRNKGQNLYFRSTYSGDIFSIEFARAFVKVCNKFPQVQFWIYTRSHDFVEILSEAKNMAVYISVDPVNLDSGNKVHQKLLSRNNVAMAWMGESTPTDTKFVVCPETSGKIKNTPDAGACSKCQLCFTYNDKIKLRNIKFVLH